MTPAPNTTIELRQLGLCLDYSANSIEPAKHFLAAFRALSFVRALLFI